MLLQRPTIFDPIWIQFARLAYDRSLPAVTGLDTNVLVRYLVQDEPRQARLATRYVTLDRRAARHPLFKAPR